MEGGLGTRWVGEDEDGHLDHVITELWGVAGKGRDGSSNGTRCMSCHHQAGRGESKDKDKGEGEGRVETRVGEGENSDGTR